MIFDHLSLTQSYARHRTEESRIDRRKALVSAALTCTTLSFHALNVLWRELQSIHPLLRTLPNCKRVHSHLTLTGAISEQSWSRFQLYADRVRAISGVLESNRMDPIHPAVWAFLAAKCKGSPLMPRLRSLLALDVRLSDASALLLFMSPSLRALDLFFPSEHDREARNFSPHVASSLVQTLPLMAPNLESIYYDIGIDISHGYIQSFRRLTQLKILSLTSLALDETALWELATLTTLRDLTCAIDLSNSTALTPPPQVFQNLLTLHAAGSFDDLTVFIDACHLTNLTHLWLPIIKVPIIRRPTDLFAAVSRRCNRTLMASFSATIDYEFPPESPPPNCLIQHLEPLLAFPNIKSFYLSFPRAPPSIDDDDLARFGAAWPRMIAFRVVHNRVSLRPSQYPLIRPTLSGLVDLARRCLRLQAFRVPIMDANVVPDETAVLPVGHGLRSFLLNDIALPSDGSPAYTEAVTVLNRVFPSLDLEDMQKRVWPHSEGWKKFLGVAAGMRQRGHPEGGSQ